MLVNVVGCFELLKWILKKEKYKCPRCNYPIFNKEKNCLNCGQPFDWKKTR